jgi:hypothetical protein
MHDAAETTTTTFFQKVAEPAPWISPAKLENAKRRNSDSRYRRLWLGEWTTGGGDAISEADLEAACTLPGPIFDPERRYLYGAGLDLGVRRDRCGFVVVGVVPGSGKLRVVHARSWAPPAGGDIDLRSVREEILECHARYRLSLVSYDPFQAALLSQDLTADGVPMAEMTFSGVNLDRMARDLLTAFRDKRIELFDDAQLLADLRSLSITERAGGFGYKLTAPSGSGGHADLGIALACVLPAALTTAMEPAAIQGPDVYVEQMVFN